MTTMERFVNLIQTNPGKYTRNEAARNLGVTHQCISKIFKKLSPDIARTLEFSKNRGGKIALSEECRNYKEDTLKQVINELLQEFKQTQDIILKIKLAESIKNLLIRLR